MNNYDVQQLQATSLTASHIESARFQMKRERIRMMEKDKKACRILISFHFLLGELSFIISKQYRAESRKFEGENV